MKGITWGGVVAKLLSLSLLYLAAEPAQAQSSRSSSTNSAAGIRVTPTAVPSARAKTWNEVTYNTCVAPIFESMSRGVPYTGVCEREYVNGKYVCRHFARDFCKEIAAMGISETGCSILGIDLNRDDDLKITRCSAAACDSVWLTARLALIDNPVSRTLRGVFCSRELTDCVVGFIAGHAINILRLGGQQYLASYGKVPFSVVEPQTEDGGSAVLCSWTQKTLEPEIPENCKKAIQERYFPKQVACGLKYDFKVYGLDDWNAEVARQDKEMGFEIPKP